MPGHVTQLEAVDDLRDAVEVAIRRPQRGAGGVRCDGNLDVESFIGDSSFVMYLGDNLLRDGIVELTETFASEQPDALILLTPVPDPEHYGVAELADGSVSRLVEKPPDPGPGLH